MLTTSPIVDATNYCTKLTERQRAAEQLPAGYVYRLPTEAEWEYTCRAGTQTRFHYGDDPGYVHYGDYAWDWDNSDLTGPAPSEYPQSRIVRRCSGQDGRAPDRCCRRPPAWTRLFQPTF